MTKGSKTSVKYRIICSTSSRIHQALKGVKSCSRINYSGIDLDTYRILSEYQTTPEKNWTNIKIDHLRPICMFDLSNDEELQETFCGKNTQPLLKEVHQHKGTKFTFLDYQLQIF